ncbi:MAG TPA: sortase [Micromonosporaceae bacterium]|nr:sortase [Micromonosporaceae bacterium]
MTVVDSPPGVATRPAPPGGAFGPVAGAVAPGTAPTAPRKPRRISPGGQVVSSFITILSVTLLGFSLYVGFGSRLHHARAQFEAYADFRQELATATAPVGQFQPADPDHPNAPPTLLKPGAAVAVLTIPELHLKEVVFEGTAGAVLENGPGHLRDTPLPGQAGTSEIMGRATLYGGPFARIGTLAQGDTFTVTTGQGVQRYTVLGVRDAGDDLPPPPAPGAGRLVLVTATGNPFVPSGVVRVDADQTSPVQPSPPRPLGEAQLPRSELPMATDPSAWVALVLFGQALVIATGLVSWARVRWGPWQTWLVGVPVLSFFGLAVADEAVRLLPNLM